MSVILSIETATKVCSVALHREGALLGLQEIFLERSHSTHLVVMIEQLLENCQLKKSELAAIAISKGPGSYTGLRIGVATAKGLCYALGIPLIGINTLEAMAHQVHGVHPEIDYLCPMIDARRMEVYCTVVNRKFQIEAETQALVVKESSFQQWLSKGSVAFFGNGSEKCRELLQGPGALFLKEVYTTASSIGSLANVRLNHGEVEDLAYFEPYYLKEFRRAVPKEKQAIIK